MENDSNENHEYKTWELADNTTCITALAAEYRDLRTKCVIPITSVNVEGIGVVDTTTIISRLKSSTIPPRGRGSLDIVRSDMGETLAYVVLEQEYGTNIDHKLVVERELIGSPGRGIDVVGIENDGKLKLVFAEIKVSDEKSPPQVVDKKKDSISKKLKEHINNQKVTIDKIWDIIRKTRDESFRDLLISATLYWEQENWSKLHIICCGILVRPQDKYRKEDFGKLKEKPKLVHPAAVRFLIICVPGDIEEMVNEFHRLAIAVGGAS